MICPVLKNLVLETIIRTQNALSLWLSFLNAGSRLLFSFSYLHNAKTHRCEQIGISVTKVPSQAGAEVCGEDTNFLIRARDLQSSWEQPALNST